MPKLKTNLMAKPSKLTSVQILPELKDPFLKDNVITLKQLVNRSIDLFQRDEAFRNKILSNLKFTPYGPY